MCTVESLSREQLVVLVRREADSAKRLKEQLDKQREEQDVNLQALHALREEKGAWHGQSEAASAALADAKGKCVAAEAELAAARHQLAQQAAAAEQQLSAQKQAGDATTDGEVQMTARSF